MCNKHFDKWETLKCVITFYKTRIIPKIILLFINFNYKLIKNVKKFFNVNRNIVRSF